MSTMYSNIGGDDWFVREHVKEELNDKILEIANFIVQNNIEYEDYDGMIDVLMTYLNNVEDLTHDELEYVIENIQVSTALQELYEDGFIEMTDDGKYKTREHKK